MRKLKLDTDELQVESFMVLPPSPAGAGTVHGQVLQKDPTYDPSDTPNSGGDTLLTICPGPSANTCVGPTYCCPRSWDGTCHECGIWYP